MSESLEALYRLATRNNGNRRSDEEVDKDFRIIEKALKDYEAIDNSNPSEALKCLDGIEYVADVLKVNHKIGNRDIANQEIKEMVDRLNYRIPTIKQALLKAQEPKHYLRWEDLEFGKTPHKLKAKMNDSLYRIEWFIDGMGFKRVIIYLYVAQDYLKICTRLLESDKQFFNNLHLERVEE